MIDYRDWLKFKYFGCLESQFQAFLKHFESHQPGRLIGGNCLKKDSSIFVHCATDRLEAKLGATWTSFTETTYCQCNSYKQFDRPWGSSELLFDFKTIQAFSLTFLVWKFSWFLIRECKTDTEYVNQYWCDPKDLSPIKLQRCESCEVLSDYAYNENYYELEDVAYDYYSYGRKKRSTKVEKTCGSEHFEVDFSRYCPCEIPLEHRPGRSEAI